MTTSLNKPFFGLDTAHSFKDSREARHLLRISSISKLFNSTVSVHYPSTTEEIGLPRRVHLPSKEGVTLVARRTPGGEGREEEEEPSFLRTRRGGSESTIYLSETGTPPPAGVADRVRLRHKWGKRLSV